MSGLCSAIGGVFAFNCIVASHGKLGAVVGQQMPQRVAIHRVSYLQRVVVRWFRSPQRLASASSVAATR